MTDVQTVALSPRPPKTTPILEIDHLKVDFILRSGRVNAVRDVSLSIHPGESLALVGESGSGKSVTSLAVMGLLKLPGRICGGDIRWKGESLLGPQGTRRLHQIRGKELAIVFQDPMTSLNPTFTVGTQLTEVLRRHLNFTRRQATERAVELLARVGISSPRERLDQHPHEFSGGMRQRVLIAMALACEPQLLIADEPTTALDVTIQAQIIELLAEIQQELHLAVLLITHDLGVVAGLCQKVAVMYAGKVVESGPIDDLFAAPNHPYTRGLLASMPRLDAVEHRLTGIAGVPPVLVSPPPGCAFAPRCDVVMPECTVEEPHLVPHGNDGKVACLRCR
ncbi:MAG TPA: ABC transporter ATP-binding protein [Acidothermaceae bacterium]|jgi:peptide/nickel transport system ATP-binding protein|nr:ABC transporter ATP-binding protein [Acidothermaceae bacterium]